MTEFKGDPIVRAFASWYREGNTSHPVPDLSKTTEYGGKQYVVLKDDTGVLAVYRVRPDGGLKRLRRWPTELRDS